MIAGMTQSGEGTRTPAATAVVEPNPGTMSQRSRGVQALGLAGWLAATFVAAALGAVASIDAGAFYAQLARPAWAPPASVFGPVWTVLYLLMGIAAWLVWREQDVPGRSAALALFVVQLGANALWSWLFFAWRNGALAFADVLVLLALVAATVVAFRRIRRAAAMLMVPYLAWVAFASALTWAVWRGNPGLL
jgi:tryptophan-rich sensory protein